MFSIRILGGIIFQVLWLQCIYCSILLCKLYSAVECCFCRFLVEVYAFDGGYSIAYAFTEKMSQLVVVSQGRKQELP